MWEEGNCVGDENNKERVLVSRNCTPPYLGWDFTIKVNRPVCNLSKLYASKKSPFLVLNVNTHLKTDFQELSSYHEIGGGW